MFPSLDPMRICLISANERIQAAVQVSCLPPHELTVLAPQGLLAEDRTLSESGKRLIKKAAKADVVLIGWAFDEAPIINTIGYSIRKQSQVPIIALCNGGQDEMIAALAGGVDDVLHFPLYLPLLQAKVAATNRLVLAAQRATSRKIKKKLRGKADNVHALAEEKVEDLTSDLVEELQESVLPDDFPTVAEEEQVLAEAEKVIEEEAEKVVDALVDEMLDELVEAVEEELTLIDASHEVHTFGDLALDTTSYQFHIGSTEVDLTPKEFDLLRFMMENAGKACSRDQILDAVWGLDFDTGTNMVDVYMHFLRKKLDAHGLGSMLKTIRGHGYRLMLPESKPV